MKIKNSNINKFYSKESKRLKLISKSWYKIYEINNKTNIFKNNMNIIDLGSYPGGWINYLLTNFKNIKIFSCDINQIKINNKNVFFLKGDIYKIYNNFLNMIYKNKICFVDIIISDMCHKLMGHKDIDSYKIINLIKVSLKLCNDILKKEGDLLIKCFNNIEINLYIKKIIKNKFNYIKIIKPISSNKNSNEFYLVCRNFKNKN